MVSPSKCAVPGSNLHFTHHQLQSPCLSDFIFLVG